MADMEEQREKAREMLRFGVCDTDTALLDKMAAVLHQVFVPCQVEYMYGPDALEVFLRSGSGDVDVLITEIELRGRSAIDLIGRYMRESSAMQVLYMSAKMEYCTEVYETRHCGFLVKPIRRSLLERDVKRAVRLQARRKEEGILVSHGGNLHIIRPSSCVYVEGHGRIMRAITNTEAIETYEKLSDFSTRLDGRFIQCHKSYIVNMERISRYQRDAFLMDNGALIPISQSRRREAREQFLKYIGGKAAP